MRGEKKQAREKHRKLHGDRACRSYKGWGKRMLRGWALEQAINMPNTGHGGTLYRGVLQGTKKKYTIREGGR